MRINRLDFEAVGPFPGKHTIDFDQLGDSAIFLIDGPTGAGKSTIIDAITYAIFGAMAGSTSDTTRMRSLHAKPEVPTWIELVFSTQSGSYRVKRSPEYSRPARRGDGLTTEKSTILLEEQLPNGAWSVLAHQFQEAGKKIGEIVGLTREQFAQTVVLPQGEFANFLKSGVDERQPLLEKIFSTQLYSRVLDNLLLLKKEAEQSTKASISSIEERLNVFIGAVGLDPDEASTLRELVGKVEDFQLLKSNLDERKNELEKQAKNASKNLVKADQEKKKLQADLDLRKSENSAATRLANANADLGVAKTNLDAAISVLDDTDFKKELLALGFDVEFSKIKWSEAGNKVAALRAKLEKPLEVEAGLASDSLRLRESKKELAESEKVLKADAKRVSQEIPKEIQRLDKALAIANKAANRVETLEQLISKIIDEETAAKELDDLIELQKELDDKAALAVALAEQANTAFQERFESRMANIRGELASMLVDGQPCDVCGSLDHPTKAKKHAKSATEKDVQAASKAAETARKAMDTARSKCEINKGAVGEAKKKTKRPLVEINAESEKLNKELEAALEKRSEAEILESTKDELTSELEELRVRHQEDLLDNKGNKDEIKALEADNKKSQLLVDAHKLHYSSVSERAERIEALQEAVEAISESDHAFKAGNANLKKERGDFAKLAQHVAFGDIVAAESALDNYKQTYEDAVKTEATGSKELEAIKSAIDDLVALQAERLENDSNNLPVLNLAKWADGYNDLGQKLPAFVLQAMFEDVVAAANTRFSTILEGRYELRIPTEESGRKNKKGLGLAIFDHEAQEERKPTTLSGGEQFCAALSLALGLSDIVLSNNSGLSIDTFFIDEGFGSLDSDRLAQVMQMLDRLKADGRTIGLISHVEEMKSAISEHVDVKPIRERGPSSLTVSWMA
jgi:exonuclease SbcC